MGTKKTKYTEPTKLQLEIMINKGMGVSEIQKETHKQLNKIKSLLEQYGLKVKDKRLSDKGMRVAITPTKVPEKRNVDEIYNRYMHNAPMPKINKQDKAVKTNEPSSEKAKITEKHDESVMTHEDPAKKAFSECESKADDNIERESKTVTVSGSIPAEFITGETLITDKYAEASESKEIEKALYGDQVSHPSHYCQGGHECIDEMLLVFGKEAVMNFCLLNVWKYRARALYKNGVTDIEKSDWYMNKYFELARENTKKNAENIS